MTNRLLLLTTYPTYLTSQTSFLLDNKQQTSFPYSLITQNWRINSILFPSFLLPFSKFPATTRIPTPIPRDFGNEPADCRLESHHPSSPSSPSLTTARHGTTKGKGGGGGVAKRSPEGHCPSRLHGAKSRGKAREIGMRRKRGFPPVARARARAYVRTYAAPTTPWPFRVAPRPPLSARWCGKSVVLTGTRWSTTVESGGSC